MLLASVVSAQSWSLDDCMKYSVEHATIHIIGRFRCFCLNLSDNSVMRGCVHAKRTLKGLVADLRDNKNEKRAGNKDVACTLFPFIFNVYLIFTLQFHCISYIHPTILQPRSESCAWQWGGKVIVLVVILIQEIHLLHTEEWQTTREERSKIGYTS